MKGNIEMAAWNLSSLEYDMTHLHIIAPETLPFCSESPNFTTLELSPVLIKRG